MKVKKEKVFYKYKSLEGKSKENVITSIRDSYFYFSSPEQLNDNFETYVKIDFTGTDEQKIAWARECYTYNQYISGNIPQANIDYTRKRFSPETEIRQFIKCLASDLMAPDQELLEFANENEKAIKDNNQLFVKTNTLGILSLTPDCLNELMWAHYGNSGFGVCLGYSLKKKKYGYFLPLKIDEIPEYHGQYIQKVKYTRERKTFRIYDYDNPLETMSWIYGAYYKTDNWKYENEYRCVLSESFLQKDGNYRKICYAKEILTEVIFGYKVEQNDINEIKELVREVYGNKVLFYRIQLEIGDGRLSKILV